jgi:hypothetical protein
MKRLPITLFLIAMTSYASAAEPLSIRGFSLGQEASAKLFESKFEWVAFPDTLHKGEAHCDDKYGICRGEFDLNETTFGEITVTYVQGKITEVKIDVPAAFASSVIEALTQRNGPPTKKWTEVSQNGFGAQFTNPAASWDRRDQALYTTRLNRNRVLAVLQFKTAQKPLDL